MCTHLLLWELQKYNSLLNNYWQENVQSHQKKIPHVQGQRRSPSKMVGQVKSHLESNPIPTSDARRTQTKPCTLQDPETPQRLSQTAVWVSCRGMGQQWSASGAGALGAATWVTRWHKPSWRRSPLTSPQGCRADDPQTAEQLCQRNSHTVKKVLRLTTDF